MVIKRLRGVKIENGWGFEPRPSNAENLDLIIRNDTRIKKEYD